ncbi:MAG: glycosyltransferase family 4 protein [Ilumatobacteraceae bacterium]
MTAVPKVAFVFEQALGHVTHAHNVRKVITSDPSISAIWCPIPFEVTGLAARIPLFKSNWTVRSGVRARRAIRHAHRAGGLDALFIHTQVPAVLATDWLKRLPSVVSIDATPAQYDAFGDFYDHHPSHPRIERFKFQANKRCFDQASAMVSWSAWAKAGLVADYGVPADKITVIPPGVWFDQWSRPDGEPPEDGVVRILFVGAVFERKGGVSLLSAFRKLRTQVGAGAADRPTVELHLVTKSPVMEEAGVHVYADLSPNSPELLELYKCCHIFCLPTRADMLAVALCEAGAAGLALVSTSVGGIPEIVREGESGLLVPPDNVDALTAALGRLVDDPELRRRLGSNAANTVEAHFDARKNAQRLIELLHSVVAVHGGR